MAKSLFKNFYQNTFFQGTNVSAGILTKNDAHSPRSYMMPLQLQRIVQDFSTWRQAILEAENAIYPHRYRMQQMYVDKILEGHILACMDKRKRLTLQKEFKIGRINASGQFEEDTKCTSYIKNKRWFRNLQRYMMDKIFYGYSLIQLGDLVKYKNDFNFSGLTIIKRVNVSPDRHNLVRIPYQLQGIDFLDESVVDESGISYADWLVYVDTPSDSGASVCGYGLLYNCALYGILLKNNLSNNADYTQMFATPYRHAKTAMKLNEEDQEKLEQIMQQMGATGYAITDDGVSIDFKETNTGSGFQSYDNLEKRCQAAITKILLGHPNAMEEAAGKLGGTQGSVDAFDMDLSPAGRAMAQIEKDDLADHLSDLNDILLPKLRKLGFSIPEDCMFYVTNNAEAWEVARKEDAKNKTIADIAMTMKQAGLKMDAKYFEERTGIPTQEIPEMPSFPVRSAISAKARQKMNEIYNSSHNH